MEIKISFMYHDVFQHDMIKSGFQSAGAYSYKLNSREFEQQIKLIADYCASGKVHKNQVALTFDDGGESFHSIIAPILEKYEFKGYFFITTGFIGTTGFMNRKQILDLYDRGHFIGAHSHTHPQNMTKLSNSQIESEWSNSVNILNEIISSKITMASIPGGFYSELSRIALKKNGVSMIFTSIPLKKIKYNSDKQSIIGRFTIKKTTKSKVVMELLKNNSLRQIHELVMWESLAFIRSVLGPYYYQIREVLLKNRN